jgi:hypothetical protein
MPRVCEGHVMLARDSTYGLRENAQLGGSPKQDGRQLRTRIAYEGSGKQEKELLCVVDNRAHLSVVNNGAHPCPPPIQITVIHQKQESLTTQKFKFLNI